MKLNEMHIAQLVLYSDKGRDIISQFFPGPSGFDRNNLIKEIADKGTLKKLKSRLECTEDDIFKKLSEIVHKSFYQVPKSKLTQTHIQKLLLEDTKRKLSRFLNIENKPLNALFDAEMVKKSFQKVRITTPLGNEDIEDLLLDQGFCKGATGKLEAHFGFGPNEWGMIIRRENWITQYAKETFINNLSCEMKDIPAYLAQLIESELDFSIVQIENIGDENKFKLSLKEFDKIDKNPRDPLGLKEDDIPESGREEKHIENFWENDFDDEDKPIWGILDIEDDESIDGFKQPSHFDSLALTFLRERLNLVSDLFFQESKLTIEESDGHNQNKFISIPTLTLWINLFEEGTIHSAIPKLLRLLTNRIRINDIINEKNYNLRFFDGEVDQDAYFIVGEKQTLQSRHLFKTKEFQKITINCPIIDESEGKSCIEFIGLPPNEIEHLCEEILKLRPKDLDYQGDSIGERLLNTEISKSDHPENEIFRSAIHKLGKKFTQSLILSGTQISIPCSILTEGLNDKIPYSSNISSVEFIPQSDQDSICKSIIEYLHKTGKRPRIVE